MRTLLAAYQGALRMVRVVGKQLRGGGRDGVVTALLAVPALIALLRWLRAAMRREAQVTLFYNTEDARARFLVASAPALADYSPPFWMDGNMQTFWGSKCRPAPSPLPTYTRKMLGMADGGSVALDWATPPTPGARTLIILHGLTGGTQENYVQHMTEAGVEAGWGVVALIARGCSGTTLTTPRGFTACWTADVRASVGHIRGLVGDGTPLVAVGFSLGATILSRYLAEEGAGCTLCGAALLCPTMDINRSAERMATPFSRLAYQPVLAGALSAYAKRHTTAFQQVPGLDMDQALSAATVQDFDRCVVVPAFGFSDVWEYYRTATTTHLMQEHVAIPTLIAHSRDDPICCVRGIPTTAHVSNPNIVVALTQEGGHVAWLTGSLPRGRSWIEAPVLQFLGGVLAWNEAHGEPERRPCGIPLTPFSDPLHPAPAKELPCENPGGEADSLSVQ